MARRKSLDLIALLMISFLVITASAAVYYSLSQTTTIDVAGTEVWFEAGSDNGTGTVNVVLNPQKTVATVTGLKAYPNATQTYENTTMVHNNSTGTQYQVRLRHVSLSGNDTEFVFVRFTLNASVGSRLLEYTCNGTDWALPSATDWVILDTSEDAPIIIETKAKDNASTGASVTIEIAVDVQ